MSVPPSNVNLPLYHFPLRFLNFFKKRVLKQTPCPNPVHLCSRNWY
uniref:Plastid ADP-glucose pyrophosphorylase large subunit n=1 Tax=Arundo donax TaxID=35708 RepID=A0A0A9AMB0_ARUDO